MWMDRTAATTAVEEASETPPVLNDAETIHRAKECHPQAFRRSPKLFRGDTCRMAFRSPGTYHHDARDRLPVRARDRTAGIPQIQNKLDHSWKVILHGSTIRVRANIID